MNLTSGRRAEGDSGEAWLSVSDLMAGLMVIFLFIAISYIRPVLLTQDQIRSIVTAWNNSKTQIYEALDAEFARDLERWDAELEPDTLIVRFRSPEILFEVNKAELRDRFKNILSDFFPRYLSVLHRFSQNIEEIRIEGHTSREWAPSTPELEAYFNNMKLSQERTRAVLEFVLRSPVTLESHAWAKPLITANGLSSSHPILKEGVEDVERSRRVEFRIRTNAEEQIERVLSTIQ